LLILHTMVNSAQVGQLCVKFCAHKIAEFWHH